MKDLHKKIRAHIDNQTPPQFDSLFYELFQHQFEKNLPLKNYWESLGISPATISNESSWRDIPPVPTDAFKLTPNPTCLTPEQRNTTFLTSGTTGETQGIHYFANTLTYEKSILAGWKHCQLPDLHQTFILTPSPLEAPQSSLSHMMETLRTHLAPDASYLMSGGELNTAPIIEACAQGKPITLLGTALAFLHLMESLDSPLTLPTGSWAMETGGYKGTDRTLSKDELYEMFQKTLNIPADNIWNEYSMTELSSQFYTNGLDKPHIAPPWVKIRVIHPENGKDVATGEMGYLAIYDLANVDSIFAIQTQDLAIYHDEQSFTLIGRDPSALPRGCSRSADEALS